MRLRSLLFVPGDRPERMPKAAGVGADALILDLEDAVATARKAVARTEVAAYLVATAAAGAGGAARALPLFVRVNPLSSGLTGADLDAIAATRPDGYVLPKAEGAHSILQFVRLIEQRGGTVPPILPLVTETAAAMFRLGEYASETARLVGMTWGAEDLSAALGAATAREADGAFTAPFVVARALTLFAAKAAGVPAIETVFPAFRDLEGLARYAARGARDGFSGMLAIHPTQVAPINSAFTPSAEAVERARRIVALFREQPQAGVLSLDGEMVDAPHLQQAQRILAQL